MQPRILCPKPTYGPCSSIASSSDRFVREERPWSGQIRIVAQNSRGRSRSHMNDPRHHVLSLLTSGTDVYPEMNVLFTHAL